jgi:thiosulfate dehydrogenase
MPAEEPTAPSAPTATNAPPPTIAATDAPTATSLPELSGDPVRGGLLYDAWWPVLRIDAPTDDHPLWKTQSSNTRSGADTWRCKECHGWDYQGVDGAYGKGSHMTGFKGVMQASEMHPAEVLSVLMGSANPDHNFSVVLDEQSLSDLALFISESLIDANEYLNDDMTSTGDAAAGKQKYEEVCILCHGPDGNAINFGDLEEREYVGHIAVDNPWEFFHKVRFGAPGWPMPSSITNGWSDQDVADVLAYAVSFPQEPAVSGGGLMYDKWYVVLGMPAPSGDHSLWSTQTTNTRTGEDTWRCKECHGWDYKGVDGVYGSGSHMTGFPGILSAASMSAEELSGWLTGKVNPNHDFSQWMGETAVAELVTFLQTETQDTSSFINADATVSGDPELGKPFFENTCAKCHGDDGMLLNFGDADEPEFVGTIALDNPWEFFHKASFGQPGQPMPSGVALGLTMEDLMHLIAYAQTLPAR